MLARPAMLSPFISCLDLASKYGSTGRFAQGRGRGRLGYVVLAALGMVLLAPFYGGMWLYYTHAMCGTDRIAFLEITCF